MLVGIRVQIRSSMVGVIDISHRPILLVELP